MLFITVGEVTYEFTIVSEAQSDDWVVECTELSDPSGFAGAIRVSPIRSQNVLIVESGHLPLEVLHHWLSLLPAVAAEPDGGLGA
jgi:hypothetical protein